MASAMRNSASWRSAGVLSRQPSNAVAAARYARSTSAAFDTGDDAYTVSVAGSMTGKEESEDDDTYSPPMKFWRVRSLIPPT
jgi:hypothetical protein